MTQSSQEQKILQQAIAKFIEGQGHEETIATLAENLVSLTKVHYKENKTVKTLFGEVSVSIQKMR